MHSSNSAAVTVLGLMLDKRKKDHADLCANHDVQYRKSTGFERYDFIHNALPELSLEDVSTTATLLGRSFSMPLFISSMTGGFSGAEQINALVARFCEQQNLPFGVGSQRALLEDSSTIDSFSIVRKEAPGAFIAANIGGAQLAGGLGKKEIDVLVDSIRANAIIVHLNPLQEIVQEEGDRNFMGIEDGIAELVTRSGLPVIVKETGAGITAAVAERLLAVGVQVIDVAGAGGTSWSRVENERNRTDEQQTYRADAFQLFEEWGNPTADCIVDVERLRGNFRFEMIASGGIRSGLDIAKSLALGADFSATAQPIIALLKSGEPESLEYLIQKWKLQLQTTLALLGCRSPAHLGRHHLKEL
jgi:isopentenyl-diphosphate Delta-isomerase